MEEDNSSLIRAECCHNCLHGSFDAEGNSTIWCEIQGEYVDKYKVCYNFEMEKDTK